MKDRLIPLLPEVSCMLEDWLEPRGEVTHGALFVGRQGKPLALNSLVRPSEQVCLRAGVKREGVTLHALRHTFASLLVQYGCDLVSVKDALGHASLSTTSIYLHLDAAHPQEAMTRHPLSSGLAEPAA